MLSGRCSSSCNYWWGMKSVLCLSVCVCVNERFPHREVFKTAVVLCGHRARAAVHFWRGGSSVGITGVGVWENWGVGASYVMEKGLH